MLTRALFAPPDCRLARFAHGGCHCLSLHGAGRLHTGEQFQKGYILPPGALEQIPIGASQDQVLIVMGTPSTVATLNGEVFYYISQRSERPVLFMNQRVVDQRVIAIYFDKIARCSGSPITVCRTARSSTSSAAPRRPRARS